MGATVRKQTHLQVVRAWQVQTRELALAWGTRGQLSGKKSPLKIRSSQAQCWGEGRLLAQNGGKEPLMTWRFPVSGWRTLGPEACHWGTVLCPSPWRPRRPSQHPPASPSHH